MPDSGDSHTFLWQVVADNGQVIADGTTEDFSFTPFDNGSYSLTFTVTDDDGDSDQRYRPHHRRQRRSDGGHAGADQSVDEGDLVSLDPATFTDAGSNDTHTASIDWGDGSSLAVGSVTQTDGLSGTRRCRATPTPTTASTASASASAMTIWPRPATRSRSPSPTWIRS